MLDEQRLRRILRIGPAVVSELDPEAVLAAVLEEARELTGAGYAALGVLDPGRQERECCSSGCPVAHPPMRSFLGVPIVIRGRPWGNLYLADKQSADAFDDGDEEAIVLLAGWAAIAIDNADAYQREHNRRVALEQAVQGLEATTAIARALGGETDLDRILDLIAERARALIEARSVLIALRDGAELVVRSIAGTLPGAVAGMRIPVEGSFGGEVLRSGRPQRTANVGERLRFGLASQIAARAALFVPLVFHGRGLGVLEVFDRHDGADFTAGDERVVVGFAASAATAVATAQSAASEAQRRSLQSSERERRRWARELHDETLQQLAGVKLQLAAARRDGTLERATAAMTTAVDQLDTCISELRRLIAHLRPAALDEIGLAPALEGLVQRNSTTGGLQITLDVDLPPERLRPDLEDAAYRIVQEALTNAIKHAGATRVDVHVQAVDGDVSVAVADDGRGIQPGPDRDGFGLIGMRERVALLSGQLDVVAPERGGTIIRAVLPAGARAP